MSNVTPFERILCYFVTKANKESNKRRRKKRKTTKKKKKNCERWRKKFSFLKQQWV